MDEFDGSQSGKKGGLGPLLAKLRIAAVVLAALLVVFIMSKNWETQTVNLVLMKSEMPMAILILLTFLFGVGVGVLLAFLRPWKKKRS